MVAIKVNLADIFEYISSPRPVKEGEAVFHAGHVIMCGCKEHNVNEIVAFCLQTSNLTGVSHKIEIKIHENVSNWQAICSCKAGLGGKCKHITAVLIHLNRIGEVEKLSCTDLEQVWGTAGPKPSASSDFNYSSAIKMKDFCHPVTKIQKLTVDNEMMKEIDKANFEILQNCDGDSSDCNTAFSSFMHGRSSCSTAEAHVPMYYDSKHIDTFTYVLSFMDNKNDVLKDVSYVNPDKKTDFYISEIEQCDNKLIFLETINQNNELWRKERKFRITGSTCYSLFTYYRNKNPDWDKKINFFINPTFKGTPATEYGKQQEAYARELYASTSNQDVRICGFVINKRAPWLGFSPDGITDQGFLLEIKCPTAGAQKNIDDILPNLTYLFCDDGEYYLKKNHMYYGQIQFGMALLNLEYTDFIIYSSFQKSIHIIKIKKNNEFCEELLLVLKNIFFDKILPYVNKINK